MKLTFKDIENKHEGETCIVTLHGPSLSPYINDIEYLQKEKKKIVTHTTK